MVINIDGKNEFSLTPEFAGNREQERPMKVIFRRVNSLILNTNAVTAQGKFAIIDWVKTLVVRIENPIEIFDGTSTTDITIDDVFKWPELQGLADEVFNFAKKTQDEGRVDSKN